MTQTFYLFLSRHYNMCCMRSFIFTDDVTVEADVAELKTENKLNQQQIV